MDPWVAMWISLLKHWIEPQCVAVQWSCVSFHPFLYPIFFRLLSYIQNIQNQKRKTFFFILGSWLNVKIFCLEGWCKNFFFLLSHRYIEITMKPAREDVNVKSVWLSSYCLLLFPQILAFSLVRNLGYTAIISIPQILTPSNIFFFTPFAI